MAFRGAWSRRDVVTDETYNEWRKQCPWLCSGLMYNVASCFSFLATKPWEYHNHMFTEITSITHCVRAHTHTHIRHTPNETPMKINCVRNTNLRKEKITEWKTSPVFHQIQLWWLNQGGQDGQRVDRTRNVYKLSAGKSSSEERDHLVDRGVDGRIIQDVLGRTNRLLSFDTTRTAQKTTPPILRCRGNVFTGLLPRTIGGYTDRPTDSPLITHGPHRKWCVQQFFYCCIRCRGSVFTEPLPSNDKRDTHTDTQTDGRDLWSTPMRWVQLPWYTHQVSWRLVQAFES
jgi:hypothetical protein